MDMDEIAATIMKARKGIDQYLDIMAMFPDVDVSTNRDFQRRFNHFYRIRQRSKDWYANYYSFMERSKGNALRFEDVLDHLHATLGLYEPSFSSKLASTISPGEPVWDRYVIQNIGLKPPSYSSPRKIVRAKSVFQEIREWYIKCLSSDEGRSLIEIFNESVDQHHKITDIKKIDFILWQTRSLMLPSLLQKQPLF